MKRINTPKKYIVMAKVADLPNGKADVVKYRCDNLLKFVDYLECTQNRTKNGNSMNDWVWIKVYANVGANKRMQLAYYTKSTKLNCPGPPQKKDV